MAAAGPSGTLAAADLEKLIDARVSLLSDTYVPATMNFLLLTYNGSPVHGGDIIGVMSTNRLVGESNDIIEMKWFDSAQGEVRHSVICRELYGRVLRRICAGRP